MRNRILQDQLPTVLAGCVVFLVTLNGLVTASDAGPFEAQFDSLSLAMEKTGDQSSAVDSTATLADYLALAAERSPALRSAFYEWNGAVERSGYAGAMPDPVLSYSYFVENVETRVGPQEYRIGLRQALPWFGTLGARKAIASESANIAYRKFEAARNELDYRVTVAYYEYYFLARDIEITTGSLELLSMWEAVARNRYKTGLTDHPDLIKVQIELAQLENRLISLKDQRAHAAARLRAEIGLPSETNLPYPLATVAVELSFNKAAVRRSVSEHNPELLALEHSVQREEAGLSLARKASLPSFAVGVDYIRTGAALDPMMSDSGKDPWLVGVSINLPLWFGKNRAKKEEALARRNQYEHQLRESRNQHQAYAEQLLFEYDDAVRQLRLYRDGLIPKAEQSLQVTYAAYQSGESDFLSLLDAQRQWLEFQRLNERAVVDIGIGRAKLELLTGESLSELTDE